MGGHVTGHEPRAPDTTAEEDRKTAGQREINMIWQNTQNKEKNALYRARTRDHHRAANAVWYAANRDRILARVKVYSTSNKDHILVYQAEYYAANTEKVKSNVSVYRKANPEKRAHLENRSRVRKVGNGGSHTREEWAAKADLFGSLCVYCGESKPLTRDHKIPLARGGTDDIANILPACRSCNSKKNKQTAAEYFGRTNHQRSGGLGGDAAGSR
jgi:5-methylcytosine-specific restriction endonuclease McrA